MTDDHDIKPDQITAEELGYDLEIQCVRTNNERPLWAVRGQLVAVRHKLLEDGTRTTVTLDVGGKRIRHRVGPEYPMGADGQQTKVTVRFVR